MKVVVIDDAPEVSEVITLCFQLRWSDCAVLPALTGAEGISLVAAERPDVILLDIGLPDINGFEVCRQIRRFSNAPLLFLTVRDKEEDMVKGLELGAQDYITKPFSHIELLARVQAALRFVRNSSPHFKESPFSLGKLWMDFQRRQLLVEGQEVRLTSTEFHLLYHLLKNAGCTITYRTLLNDVWGPEYIDALNYLKVHIHHLQQKLGESPEVPTIILLDREGGCKLSLPSQSGVTTKKPSLSPFSGGN